MRYIFATTVLALFSTLGLAQPSSDRYYNAEVVSVYDGDTVRMNLELGIGVWIRNEPIRLHGIDAPEVRGSERPQGLLAKEALINLMADHNLSVQTYKDKRGKYGRVIGTIWALGKGDWCPKEVWCNVNEQLVSMGHATEENY